MARRGRGARGGAERGSKKEDVGKGKKKAISKEARAKLVKQLTSELESLVDQQAKYGKVIDDLDILSIGKQYSFFLENDAEGRGDILAAKAAEKAKEAAAKDKGKADKKGDKKKAAVGLESYETPKFNYGLSTDPADVSDMPAVTLLAQLRQHLLDKAIAASGAVDSEETQSLRRQLLAHLIETKREANAKAAKAAGGAAGGADASSADAPAARAPLPSAVALGITAIFSFLAEASETHPELCVKPLRLLSDVIAGFKPQELSSEDDAKLLGGVASMLETFAKIELADNAPTATATGADATTLASVMADAKSTGLSAMMALALAKGTLNDVLSVVRVLLGQVSTSTDSGSASSASASTGNKWTMPVPSNLQVLTKAARGVTTSSLVMPSTDTFAAGWSLPAEALAASGGAAGGASILASADGSSASILPSTPSSLLSDGSHLYAYVPSVRSIVKVGSGYNDTEAGSIQATALLEHILVAGASSGGRSNRRTAALVEEVVSKAASTRVALAMLPGGTDMLVIATPDPATGVGSALRKVRTSDLSVAGVVTTPFHGGALSEDEATAASAGGLGPIGDITGDLTGDATAPAPAASTASASGGFLVFSSSDGTIYTLSRAPVGADDASFGRAPASMYASASPAADGDKDKDGKEKEGKEKEGKDKDSKKKDEKDKAPSASPFSFGSVPAPPAGGLFGGGPAPAFGGFAFAKPSVPADPAPAFGGFAFGAAPAKAEAAEEEDGSGAESEEEEEREGEKKVKAVRKAKKAAGGLFGFAKKEVAPREEEEEAPVKAKAKPAAGLFKVMKKKVAAREESEEEEEEASGSEEDEDKPAPAGGLFGAPAFGGGFGGFGAPPPPMAFGAPAFGGGFGGFGAAPMPIPVPEPPAGPARTASEAKKAKEDKEKATGKGEKGDKEDAARPAGATRCILRKYSYAPSTTAGTAVEAAAGGAASASTSSTDGPAGKLRLESSTVLYVPPSAVDCQWGLAGKPEWTVPELEAEQAATTAAAAAVAAAGGMGALPSPAAASGKPFPRWLPGLTEEGAPVLIKSVVTNNSTTVAIASNGVAYYTGDGRAIGADACSGWTRYDGVGDAKIRQIALAPRCRHALIVTEEGELHAVGAAEDGQLGLEIKSDKQKEILAPRKVEGALEGKTVVYASVWEGKSACVTSDGKLFTWGSDSGHGELGWSGGKRSLRRGGARKKLPVEVPLGDGGLADAPIAKASSAAAVAAAAAAAGGAGAGFAPRGPAIVKAAPRVEEIAKKYVRGDRKEEKPQGEESKYAFTLPDLATSPEEVRSEAWLIEHPAVAAELAGVPASALDEPEDAEFAAMVAAAGDDPELAAALAASRAEAKEKAEIARAIAAAEAEEARKAIEEASAASADADASAAAAGGAGASSEASAAASAAPAPSAAIDESDKKAEEEAAAAKAAAAAAPPPFGTGVDPRETHVVSVFVSSSHLTVLTKGGAVWTIGDNARGQCGRPDAKPMAAGGAAGAGEGDKDVAFGPVPGLPTRAVQVAVGDGTTLIVCADGSVWAYGDNSTRACGVEGDADIVRAPARVPFVSAAPHAAAESSEGKSSFIINVSTGGYHSTAVAADGTAWAWGRNKDAQLAGCEGVQAGDVSNVRTPRRCVAITHGADAAAAALKPAPALPAPGGGAAAGGEEKKPEAPAAPPAAPLQSEIALAFAVGSNIVFVKRPCPLPQSVLASSHAITAADSFALVTPTQAASAQAAYAYVARVFKTNGAFVSDRVTDFSDLLTVGDADGAAAAAARAALAFDEGFEMPESKLDTEGGKRIPVACVDAANGLVWASASLHAAFAKPTLAFARFEASRSASDAAGAASADGAASKALRGELRGRQVLADPRFAIPVGDKARVPPIKAAVSLLGMLDAFIAHGSASTPAAGASTATPAAGAPATKGGSSASALLRAPMEELSRFKVNSPMNGWGMGNIDGVAFKTSEDIYIFGVGLYGASDNYKGKVYVTPGHDTTKEKLVEQTFEIERKGTGEITECLFDEPVLLSAGEFYHLAQEHLTTHVTGWYNNGGGGYHAGAYKVDSDSGVEFVFEQTRDHRNNGSSVDRGQLPKIFFKTAASIQKARAAAKATTETTEGAEATIDLNFPLLTRGLNGNGLTSSLAIADWALAILEKPQGTAATGAGAGSLQLAAKFALGVVLRTLATNLAAEASAKAAAAPGSEEGGLIPSDSEVAEGVKAREEIDVTTVDDPADAAAQAVIDKRKATKTSAPAWLPAESAAQATTLWTVDSTLRRILSLSASAADAAVLRDARSAYVAAFPALYPTWKLKLQRLQSLLGSINAAGAAAARTGSANAASRLLDAVLEALSKEKALAGILYDDSAAAVSAAPVTGGGAAGSASGPTPAVWSVGVAESKEAEDEASAAALAGLSSEERDYALAVRLSLADAAAAGTVPGGASGGAAARATLARSYSGSGSLRASAPKPVSAAARAGLGRVTTGPLASVAASLEPLLGELYASEAAIAAAHASAAASGAAKLDGVSPLLALLQASTSSRLASAATPLMGGHMRTGWSAAAKDKEGAFEAPAYLQSAASLLGAIVNQVAAEIGKPLELEGDNDEEGDAKPSAGKPKFNGSPSSVNRFPTVCGIGWGYGGSPDAICFRVDTPCYIAGYLIYGGSPGEYTGDMKLFEGTGPAGGFGAAAGDGSETLGEAAVTWESTSGDPCEVLFDEPILIEADKQYCAHMTVTSRLSSQSGSGGMTSVEGDDGITFTFEYCPGSNNGTSTSGGQLPGILYYPVTAGKGGAEKKGADAGAKKVTGTSAASLAALLAQKKRKAKAAAAAARAAASGAPSASDKPVSVVGPDTSTSISRVLTREPSYGGAGGLFGDEAEAAPAPVIKTADAKEEGDKDKKEGPASAEDESKKQAAADAEAAAVAAAEAAISEEESALAAALAARQARLDRFTNLVTAFIDHARAVLQQAREIATRIAEAAAVPATITAEGAAPAPAPAPIAARVPAILRAVLETDPVLSQLLPRAMAHISRMLNADASIAADIAAPLANLLTAVDAVNADVRAEEVDKAADKKAGPAGTGAPGRPRLARHASDDNVVLDLSTKETKAARGLAAADADEAEYYRTVIETEHPYLPAARKQWDLALPESVRWMIVAFDPLCATTQPEDRVTLFTDASCSRRLGYSSFGQPLDAPDIEDPDKKKRALLAKKQWPTQPLIVAGNKLSVVFESASDNVGNAAASKWGIRLTVTAHGMSAPEKAPLVHLERELAHAASLAIAHSMDFTSEAGASSAGQAALAAALAALRGKQGAAAPAAAGPGGWRPVSAYEWEPVPGGAADIDGDSVVASRSYGSSGAMLSVGCSSGELKWELSLDEETTSQCTCFGVCTTDISNPNYTNSEGWMYRCFNGALYKLGAQVAGGRGGASEKINRGDTVTLRLDMDAGVLYCTKNDEEEHEIFSGIHDKVGVGGEVRPCILFYSTGPGRKMTLQSIQAKGGKPGAFGGAAAAPAKKAGGAAAGDDKKGKKGGKDDKKDAAPAVAAAPEVDDAELDILPPWAQIAAKSRLFSGGLADAGSLAAVSSHLAFLNEFRDASIPAYLLDASKAADGSDAEAAELVAGAQLATWLHRLDSVERRIARAVSLVCNPAAETDAAAAGGAAGENDAKAAADKDGKKGDDKKGDKGKKEAEEAPKEDGLIAPVAPEAASAIRAAFGAFLWHAGLVQDAVVAATMLQSQPTIALGEDSAAAEGFADKLITELVPAPSSAATASARAKEAAVAAKEAYARATAATDAVLPPGLRALVHIFRAVNASLRAPLSRAAAAAINSKPNPKAAAAALAAAGLADLPVASDDPHAAYDALRKRMHDANFVVKGGAENSRAPSSTASIPKSMAREIDTLIKARAGLPLHLTPDMRWESKKARAMNMPEDDAYMAGPAKSVERPAPGGFAFGAAPVDPGEAFVYAKPFDYERYAIHYFELEVLEKGKDNVVCVGLIPEHETSYKGHLGWKNKTMGFHGDDGVCHCSSMPSVDTFGEGDTVGVGYVPALDYVFFTLNGAELTSKGGFYSPAFFADGPARSLTEEGMWKLRPAVTAREGAVVIANFGQAPFMFHEMEKLRAAALEAAAKGKPKAAAPKPVAVVGGGAAAGDPSGAASASAASAGAIAAELAAELAHGSVDAAGLRARARLLLALTPACLAAKVGGEQSPDLATVIAKAEHDASCMAGCGHAHAHAAETAAAPATSAAEPPAAPTLTRSASSMQRAASVSESDIPDPQLRRPSASLRAASADVAASTGIASPLLATTSGSAVSRGVAISGELLRYLVQGPSGLRPKDASDEEEDGSAGLDADEEIRTLQSVLKTRQDRAHQRKGALLFARDLLKDLQSPVAVQELLWALSAVLAGPTGALAAALAIAEEAAGGEEEGAGAEGAGGNWLMGSAKAVAESPLFADLNGCGAALLQDVRHALHSLLEAVAEQLVYPAADSGAARKVFADAAATKSPCPMSSARHMVQLMALRVWRLPLDAADHTFLQNSAIFARLRDLMQSSAASNKAAEAGKKLAGGAAAIAGAGAGVEEKQRLATLLEPVDISGAVAVEATSNKERTATLFDPTTESYWEPEGQAAGRELMITIKPDGLRDALLKTKEKLGARADQDASLQACLAATAAGAGAEASAAAAGALQVGDVAVYVDHVRDKERRSKKVTLSIAGKEDEVELTDTFAGWVYLRPPTGLIPIPSDGSSITATVKFSGGNMPRVRAMRVFARPAAPIAASGDGLRVDAAALVAFRALAGQVFAGLGGAEGGADAAPAEEPVEGAGDAPAPELRQRLAGMLFDTGKKGALHGLQERVLDLIAQELSQQGDRFKAAKPWAAAASTAAAPGGAAGGAAAGAVPAAPAPADAPAAGAASKAPDAFCYELVSMLQSLTNSAEGRAQVARPALFATCVQLFPVASPRIQRSLLTIFRRVLPTMRPDALDHHLKVPQALLRDTLVKRARMVESGEAAADSSAMVSEDDRKLVSGPGAFAAYLLLALSKAVGVQTRGRAGGRAVTSTAGLADDMLPGSVPASVALSFASLLRSLAVESKKDKEEKDKAAKEAEEEKPVVAAGGAGASAEGGAAASPSEEANKDAMPSPKKAPQGPTWSAVLKATVSNVLAGLPQQMETVLDSPAKCAYLPQLWLSVGGLLMSGEEHKSIVTLMKPAPPKPTAAETAAAAGASAAGLVEEDAICDNHQDGRTLADVTCESCGPHFREDGKHAHFCNQCDHVMHMRKATREHARVPIASRIKAAAAESSATSVDHIEGCTRFKLAWLQLAIYDGRMKAQVEFKKDQHPSAKLAAASGVPIDRCRFCNTDLTPETRSRVAPASPALEMVCNNPDCEEKATLSCRRIKDCGHFCGGVCDEGACLPCYHGCDGVAMEADVMCNVCMTENLGEAPSIRLGCGHTFHYGCIRDLLKLKWKGPRIQFGFMNCPTCRRRVDHETLRELLDPLLKLEELVVKKALMRLSYENLDKAPELSDPTHEFYRNPAGYAMHRFAYFQCSKCSQPYYGGEARCGAAAGDDDRFNPADLVCTNCMPHSADAECSKHGRDYITYKCQFCCSEALFFCFGTTHFCDKCHSNPGMMQDLKTRGALPHCPAGPLGKQLTGSKAECELKSKHPEPGEEFVLGCSICRNASTF